MNTTIHPPENTTEPEVGLPIASETVEAAPEREPEPPPQEPSEETSPQESSDKAPKTRAILPLTQPLRPIEPRTMGEMRFVAEMFAASGLFAGVSGIAQAFVKIMAGREMGFGAFQSMSGIHLIRSRDHDGDFKPVVGANLMAAAVKRSDQYDYKIRALTNQECVIEFYEHGRFVDISTFTMADARLAGLVKEKSGWEKNPRNMLFARALSNGVKWYCPDVFSTPVYTADEMGVEVDEDGNLVIDGEYNVEEDRDPSLDRLYEFGEGPHMRPKNERQQPPADTTRPGAPIQGGKADRRIPTGEREPAKEGPAKANRPPDPDMPWQDVIAHYDNKRWSDYWKEMRKRGLTNEEVHAALGNPVDPATGKVSVKGFAGTRTDHNFLLLNAERAKKGLDPLAAPQPPAEEGERQPTQPKTRKGKPFHMPDDPPAQPKNKRGVSMADSAGLVTVARITATARPGGKPRLVIYGMDASGKEDELPAVTLDTLSTAELRKLFGDLVPTPISPDGSTIYTSQDPNTAMAIPWLRKDGEITLEVNNVAEQ